MAFSIVASASDAVEWKVVNSPQNFVVDGIPVKTEALNINGYNYVKVAEFAKLLDIDISYDETTDTVSFYKTKPYSEVRVVNSEPIIVPVTRRSDNAGWSSGGFLLTFPDSILNQADRILDTGGTITYKNISTNEAEAFQVINYFGDDIVFLYPSFGNASVGFSYYVSEVSTSEDFDKILSVLASNNNIDSSDEGGISTVPDTENTRKAVSEVFRVYINNQPVAGKIASSRHQNQYSYWLRFDKSYDLADVETVRIEIGFRDNQE
jgi:hypothetical protein